MATANSSIASRYDLVWDQTTQWANFPELGDIYTQEVQFWTLDNYRYTVSFDVGSGQWLGLLFAKVVQVDLNFNESTLHYCFGQFYTNEGAMLFAKFALSNFIETETWLVCPSFQAIEYIWGDPYTLSGEQLVSEII